MRPRATLDMVSRFFVYEGRWERLGEDGVEAD